MLIEWKHVGVKVNGYVLDDYFSDWREAKKRMPNEFGSKKEWAYPYFPHTRTMNLHFFERKN